MRSAPSCTRSSFYPSQQSSYCVNFPLSLTPSIGRRLRRWITVHSQQTPVLCKINKSSLQLQFTVFFPYALARAQLRYSAAASAASAAPAAASASAAAAFPLLLGGYSLAFVLVLASVGGCAAITSFSPRSPSVAVQLCAAARPA